MSLPCADAVFLMCGDNGDLAQMTTVDVLQDAYTTQLGRRVRPQVLDVTEAALRRLDDQLTRVRQLSEYSGYDWPTFVAKRDEIAHE